MKELVIYSCITCNKSVQDAIWNSAFFPNLFTMLSAFFVLGVLVAILSIVAGNRYKKDASVYSANQIMSPVPLTVSAIVLGIGSGGLIDGIVFHQILQWHAMLSNKMAPVTLVAKSVNAFWDGIFSGFCMLVILVGIVLLWKMLWRKDINRSSRLLAGGMLLGWGFFNMIEGLINHLVLKLHNVREVVEGRTTWNLAFLGFAFVLIIVGYILVNTDRIAKQEARRRIQFNGSRKKMKIKIWNNL